MPSLAKMTLEKTQKMETISYAVEGYLNKYSPKKKLWKQRYFVLSDGNLSIYKKKVTID